jgi:hypothetical protein
MFRRHFTILLDEEVERRLAGQQAAHKRWAFTADRTPRTGQANDAQ